MSNILTSENSSIIDDIMFCQPKKIQGGSYLSSCYLTNENNNYPIYIQTPPFQYTGIKTKQNHAIIEIEENESNTKLFKLVEKLESKSLPIICQNSSDWFRTEISLEYLQQSFEKQIKLINNKRVLQLKFPFKNNEITLDIVNTNNEQVKFSDLENKKIMGIFKYEGIKFLKNRSYLDFALLKIQLQKENLTDLIIPTHNEIKIENIENINFSKYEDDNDDIRTVIEEEILDHNQNIDLSQNSETNEDIQVSEEQKIIDSINTDQINNNAVDDLEVTENNFKDENIDHDDSKNNNDDTQINVDNQLMDKSIVNDQFNDVIDNINFESSNINDIEDINLENLDNLDKVDLDRYESYDYNSNSNDSENIQTSDLEANKNKDNLSSEINNIKEINMLKSADQDASKLVNQDELIISNLESNIKNLEIECLNSKNIYDQKLSNLRAERLKLNKLKGKKKKDSETEIIIQ